MDLEYQMGTRGRARRENESPGGLQKGVNVFNLFNLFNLFNVFNLFLFWCCFLVLGARSHFVALWIRVRGGGAGETRGIDESHELGDASKAVDA